MRITTLTLLAGVLLGLTGGAAMATTPSCQKTGNGHSCTVPGDSTVYNVATSSQATAIASVIASQNQQQQQSQNQSQTSENTNTNVATGGEGGNSSIEIGDTYVSPAINGGAAHICVSMPTGGICWPLKAAMIAARLDLMDRCAAKTGKWYTACLVSIAKAPEIRKALIAAGLAK